MKNKIRISALLLTMATFLSTFAACSKPHDQHESEASEHSTAMQETVSESRSEERTEVETILSDECADHRDAYYIIEAVSEQGKNGIPNGWNYDNRFDLLNTTGQGRSVLYDDSDERFYRLIRDFDPEDNGTFRLEMLLDVSSTDGGVYVVFEDEKDNRLFGLTVKNGKWALSGAEEKVTSVAVAEKESTRYAIEMNFDLDKQTMSVVINNVDCGSVKISASIISRLVLGTNKVGQGTLSMIYVRLSKNYAVNHHFLTNDSNLGQTPVDWQVAGDFKLANINSMRLYDMTSVKADSKAGSTSAAIHTFDAVSGKVAFETMILLPKKTDGASVSLMSGDTEAVKFETRDGKIYVGDQPVNDYLANVWQTLHIEANTDTKTADIYVNGKKKATVAISETSFDGIKIAFSPKEDAVMWFDDVEVYNLYDHSDYPAEPQIAESTDYNIGMNVCWLWRDQQSGEGWDAVSPFSEFDTYLGFYDEGLRETADWELKWMAEHGIDFINVCWYCPSGDVQAPIKEMRHSYAALHDGYMMADYSEYVDFCIMWENNKQDCTSFEQFKEYIWSYWVEYYFSDSRYVRIDNKAVLTIWNLEAFVQAFGGNEGAKAAVDFMNDELKKMGYDGIIILYSITSVPASDVYTTLDAIGFSGTYGYHWRADGANAEHQINSNNSSISNAGNISHHVPTVSIGFNDIGRNNIRNPIISAEDHLKICEYIKEKFPDLKSEAEAWKSNTLFISTWNEFSEGTYVLPTEATGFSYLENIRNTFTNDTSDHTKLDVKLTEDQLDRIGHLYPPNHSPIRWYQFEKSDEERRNDPAGEDLVSVIRYDMSTKDGTAAWAAGHGLAGYKARDGVIWGRSNADDFSIVSANRFETFDAEDAPILHIRMKNDKSANMEIFFTTDAEPTIDASKKINGSVTATGDFVDYYIDMSASPKWKGQITWLRIDPQTTAGTFEISLIEFLNYPVFNPDSIYKVKVNNAELSFTFDPVLQSDGDLLISAETGFFSAMRLYHEWDRFTDNGVLTLYTYGEKKLIFTVGSDKVIIDGKETDLGFTFTLRDGLPQFHIQKLCDLLDYKYKMNGKALEIQAATDAEYQIIMGKVPNQWEFENNGETEGWSGQNSKITTENGYLCIQPTGDDVAVIHSVSFDAAEYSQLVIGMIYDKAFVNQSASLFFITSKTDAFASDRCIKASYNIAGKKPGDIVEVIFDLRSNPAFADTITALRFDPYTGMYESQIAYVRCVKEIEK